MTTRRKVLTFAGTAGAAFALGFAPGSRATTLSGAARAALDESEVIYLTPLKSNGEESRCHGEVWFAHDAGDVFVVTAAGAWRAKAVGQGLVHARIWVGEFGVWSSAGEKYRTAPQLEVVGSIETAADVRERALEALGRKYRMEWVVWGPRFRNGIADGSRVLLRYRQRDV